ncbi:MAG: tRNA uridine-5-carboxymethylaminomethyl(34) synthesis GTPase MnmE [Ruminococcaceae bacterium]|nr:tRNA uridine-5-carboxymethylaminomethyl(34) synthesis GTPase MnmE [Oscillospiraceae bacterium]
MRTDDTITAVATPRGTGGVAVIRISGPDAFPVADKVFFAKHKPSAAQPRLMQYGKVQNGDTVLDMGMCVTMPAPHSFTGEDVCELHIHGGAHLTESVLQAVLDAGARLALPGEFTKRAFINGKLDLARAEAVGDLIHATADKAAIVAVNQLEGRLSKKISAIRDSIIDLTAQLSVAADYPEEDIDYLTLSAFTDKLTEISEALDKLVASARGGQLLREGVRCAIVGRPNTGKSSLLNAIVGSYRAIVTDIAGTTRDIVEEVVSMGGIAVKFGDTAGLREGEGEAEKMGIQMARTYVKESDFCLVVLDSRFVEAADREILDFVKDKPHIIVLNKKDLAQYAGEFSAPSIHISAATGEGLEELENAVLSLLDSFVGDDSLRHADAVRLTNTRQRDAAVKARNAVQEAMNTIENGFPADLVAVDLENAAAYLGEIVGLSVSDEVISRIFEKFCLGK